MELLEVSICGNTPSEVTLVIPGTLSVRVKDFAFEGVKIYADGINTCVTVNKPSTTAWHTLNHLIGYPAGIEIIRTVRYNDHPPSSILVESTEIEAGLRYLESAIKFQRKTVRGGPGKAAQANRQLGAKGAPYSVREQRRRNER